MSQRPRIIKFGKDYLNETDFSIGISEDSRVFKMLANTSDDVSFSPESTKMLISVEGPMILVSGFATPSFTAPNVQQATAGIKGVRMIDLEQMKIGGSPPGFMFFFATGDCDVAVEFFKTIGPGI